MRSVVLLIVAALPMAGQAQEVTRDVTVGVIDGKMVSEKWRKMVSVHIINMN